MDAVHAQVHVALKAQQSAVRAAQSAARLPVVWRQTARWRWRWRGRGRGHARMGLGVGHGVPTGNRAVRDATPSYVSQFPHIVGSGTLESPSAHTQHNLFR